MMGAAFATGMDFSNVGALQGFTLPVSIEVLDVHATVDLKPQSLQKKSQGHPFTAFIELPEGYDVCDIVVDTVKLCRDRNENGTFDEGECLLHDGPPGGKPQIGDYDGDGIPDLKVTFGRAEVIALVSDVATPATVTFTVSGTVVGCTFSGTDTVKLID